MTEPDMDGTQPDASVDMVHFDAMPLPDLNIPPDMAVSDQCDPPLMVDPTDGFTSALDLVTLQVSGGTGEWGFELIENHSGAILNETTGAYLAGETLGATDVIRVTDEGCEGEVIVQMSVVTDIEVIPLQAQIEPGTVVIFEARGGSGSFTFKLFKDGAGGSIDADGRYEAGPNLGIDIIQVQDSATGRKAEAVVEVVAEASLRPLPQRLYLPVDARHPVRIDGGSGVFDLIASEPIITIEEGYITGLMPGRTELNIQDRFQDLETTITVDVMPSLQTDLRPFGDGYIAGRIRAVGDLDGDGFDDAIVGLPEADVGAYNDGAVYVYAGSANGLVATPVQILTGAERNDEFGRAIEIADLDGDGQLDLIVGARLMDVGGGDTGAFLVYPGLDGGFFAEEPSQIIGGIRGGDHLGYSLAACDFNGDGRLDLAVGALLWEDRDADPVANNQGGIHIHLGYPDGFLPQPDQILRGVQFVEGAWANQKNLQFGFEVAAGDLDGDGLCDLVGQANQYAAPGGGAGDGGLYIYRGLPVAEMSAGGLTDLPVRMFHATDVTTSNLGRRLAVGDIDGDGTAEIVAGAHRWDVEGFTDPGAVLVFDIDVLGNDPAAGPEEASGAELIIVGNASYDNYGWAVSIADVDGDGVQDVIVGAINEEVEGGPSNVGALIVHLGRRGMLPDPEGSIRGAGAMASERLGSDVAALDSDGDGTMDFISFADRTDQVAGLDVGQAYAFRGGDIVGIPLELPRTEDPAGAQFGYGGSIVGDIDGDGQIEMVIGAPAAGTEGTGPRTGAAFIYRGLGSEPVAQLANFHPNHSGFDLLGYAAEGIGDFNGDGLPDFAVMGRADEMPNNLDDTYQVDGDCVRSNNQGVLYIFLGREGGLPTAPSYMAIGVMPNGNPEVFAGGVDVNNDGLDDVVIGAFRADFEGANDSGRVDVFLGRAPADGKVRVICDSAFHFEGTEVGQQVGRSVVGIDDLDGDGCDEFAFGAPLEDAAEQSNQGAVRIIYGWGGAGCPAEPRMAKLTNGIANTQMGWSLAAGGVGPDAATALVIGAPNYLDNGVRVGAALVVPNQILSALTPVPVISNSDAGLNILDSAYTVVGEVAGERLGLSVEIIGRRIAVGGPFGAFSGVSRVGIVRIHTIRADRIAQRPWAVMVGETFRPGGQLGGLLFSGRIGGQMHLGVGGISASGAGLDTGAVYLMNVGDPL